jgi:hypothetical protein
MKTALVFYSTKPWTIPFTFQSRVLTPKLSMDRDRLLPDGHELRDLSTAPKFMPPSSVSSIIVGP